MAGLNRDAQLARNFALFEQWKALHRDLLIHAPVPGNDQNIAPRPMAQVPQPVLEPEFSEDWSSSTSSVRSSLAGAPIPGSDSESRRSSNSSQMSGFRIPLTDRGMSLEQILNELPIAEYGISKVKEDCVICLTSFEPKDPIRYLPCFHKFHLKCIDTWISKTANCPLCMKVV